MKNLIISLIISISCSTASQAALTVLEDFESLALGSINMQHEITEWGYPVNLWAVQANTSVRRDHGWSTVEATGGAGDSKCLQLINRDFGGEIDTVFTAFYLGEDNAILDQGTIYLQYKADTPNGCIVGFNDDYAGYESDIDGDPISDTGNYQGTVTYTRQSALFRMGADQDFYARHDGSYQSIDLGQQSNVWYEVWIQFDVPAKATRYYVCEAGGTPELVINPATSTEWFGWRDDTNNSVYNMKIFFGGQNDWAYESKVWVDNIAVEQAHTTESLYPIGPVFVAGDVDCDGDVDITDFLILKSNYGTSSGADWYDGDMNGDGSVDISDFLLLKANYGYTS